MSKKILVICTLKDALVSEYSDYLEYLPLSNEESDLRWSELIQQYQPEVIVFGLQTIDDTKLSIWRKHKSDASLKFVRKGTSLHRVDFDAAKKYNILIRNTPGVNSPFVAQFITNIFLQHEENDSPIAVVGVGDIGTKTAIQLLEARKSLLLFNRTHRTFHVPNCAYSDNLIEIFSKAKFIAICLPLTAKTNGLIAREHIESIPENGVFVCISPPRVLSAEAVRALDQRKDIFVIFDHVSSGLAFIHESLQRDTLRENFLFEEKAAAGYECQYAMGLAAIKEALQ